MIIQLWVIKILLFQQLFYYSIITFLAVVWVRGGHKRHFECNEIWKGNLKSTYFPFTLGNLIQGIRYCCHSCILLLIYGLMMLNWGSIQAHSSLRISQIFSFTFSESQTSIGSSWNNKWAYNLFNSCQIPCSSCIDSRAKYIHSYNTKVPASLADLKPHQCWRLGSSETLKWAPSVWVPVFLCSTLFYIHLSL